MTLQILFPGALHRWFERQDQHLPPAHLFCQLIGGECLPEAHLGIPEEVRRLIPVASQLCFISAATKKVTRREIDPEKSQFPISVYQGSLDSGYLSGNATI
jgi:hypothetical protein